MNGYKHHPWLHGADVTAQPSLEDQVRDEFLEEETSQDRLRAARGIANAATIVVALALLVLFLAHFARSAIVLAQH